MKNEQIFVYNEHLVYLRNKQCFIVIGIANFVADISLLGISVKTHIGASLRSSNYVMFLC